MNTLISFLEKIIPLSDQKLISVLKFLNKGFLVLAFFGTLGTIGFSFFNAYDQGNSNAEYIAMLKDDLAQDKANQAEWEAKYPDEEYPGNSQYIQEELSYLENYGFKEAMLDSWLWVILGSIVGFILLVLNYRLLKIFLHSLSTE